MSRSSRVPCPYCGYQSDSGSNLCALCGAVLGRYPQPPFPGSAYGEAKAAKQDRLVPQGASEALVRWMASSRKPST